MEQCINNGILKSLNPWKDFFPIKHTLLYIVDFTGHPCHPTEVVWTDEVDIDDDLDKVCKWNCEILAEMGFVQRTKYGYKSKLFV